MAKKRISLAMIAIGVLSVVTFVALFGVNLERLKSDSQEIRIGVTNELPSSLFYLIEEKGFVEEDFKMTIVEFEDEESMIESFKKEEVNLIGLSFEGAINLYESQPDLRSVAATSSVYTPIDEETIELEDTDVFVVKEVTLASMGKEVEMVFEGWFKAVEYAQEYPESAEEIIKKETGIQENVAEYDFLTLRENITIFSYNSGPYSLYNRGKAIQTYLLENEEMEIEELIDDSIIKKIYE